MSEVSDSTVHCHHHSSKSDVPVAVSDTFFGKKDTGNHSPDLCCCKTPPMAKIEACLAKIKSAS